MSAALKLLVPVGLGLGALLAFGGKKANAAPATSTPPAGGGGITFPPLTSTPGGGSTTPGTTPASSLPGANLPTVPEAILTRMVAALATGDPKLIRAEADKLEKEGYAAQAADLRAAARLLEQGLPGNTTAPTTGAPSSGVPPLTTTLPAPTLPATLPPVVVTGTTDQQRRLVAGAAAIEAAKPKGRENKAKILAFQKQEQALGNYKGYTLDGKYGPATGALFIPLGMVPPKPMYWGKLGWTDAQLRAEKNAWKSRMHAEAMKDPQRADEWKRAGAVI